MQEVQRSYETPTDRTLHHATFKLCSDLTAVEALDEIARSFALRAAFSVGDSIAIALAVREAAANAVKHGNRFDSLKTVAVEFRITAAQLRIEITDQGGGFSAATVADPLLENNLLKASGRGLLLMRTIMDEVHFSGPSVVNPTCGATISMIKNRSL